MANKWANMLTVCEMAHIWNTNQRSKDEILCRNLQPIKKTKLSCENDEIHPSMCTAVVCIQKQPHFTHIIHEKRDKIVCKCLKIKCVYGCGALAHSHRFRLRADIVFGIAFLFLILSIHTCALLRLDSRLYVEKQPRVAIEIDILYTHIRPGPTQTKNKMWV